MSFTHVYSPKNIPGIEFEYKIRKGQPERITNHPETSQEGIDDSVTIEGAHINGADMMGFLEDHGFDWEKLEDEILKSHEA